VDSRHLGVQPLGLEIVSESRKKSIAHDETIASLCRPILPTKTNPTYPSLKVSEILDAGQDWFTSSAARYLSPNKLLLGEARSSYGPWPFSRGMLKGHPLRVRKDLGENPADVSRPGMARHQQHLTWGITRIGRVVSGQKVSFEAGTLPGSDPRGLLL
jgi:hypothetical protein